MVPVLVLLVLPLQLQDWELVRVFQSAEITNTDKSGTEASVSAAFELDGEQTRVILPLAIYSTDCLPKTIQSPEAQP